MVVLAGGVAAVAVWFVISEIITVRRNTRDLERRIRQWRGKSGEKE